MNPFRMSCLTVVTVVGMVFGAETACVLTVAPDRPTAVYSRGQVVVFKIDLRQGDKPVVGGKVQYTLIRDGLKEVGAGSLDVSGRALEVKGKLDGPGFLRCDASWAGSAGQTAGGCAAVAVDPEGIRPSLPVPEDFDAFWAEQKRRLAKVPAKVVLTSVGTDRKDLDVFDVRVDCVGPPVSGYFTRPKGAKARSLPAILHVMWAGVHGAGLGHALQDGSRPGLGFAINAHGIDNGRDNAYYEELSRGRLGGYTGQGRTSRDQCYFLGMYLRIVRAIDFLTAQPEWDGRVVVVRGDSQGGGQALVAGGLDSRVTMVAAGVPAMCDHSGRVVGRAAGWPGLVPVREDGSPDPTVLQVARYFDAVNFCTRARARTIICVGFIDTTCPPSGGYAAYNVLRGPKTMFNMPGTGHQMNDQAYAALDGAITEYLREARERSVASTAPASRAKP